MKDKRVILIISAWLFSIATVLNAQVTVTGSTGANGNYTSLTNASGAFLAINGTAQTGNTIVITITGNSTSEAGTNSLNAGAWAALTIYPTSTGLTISGSVAGPLINLNGADNVTLDGRVNATGSVKDLIITNTSTSSTAGTSTIRFINDATVNTIQYCIIKGSENVAAGGIIFFSTTTGTTGNDGNTIDNNNITSSAEANRPLNAVYSAGTAAKENSGNVISNNNIFDFLNRATASNGINLAANTTSWTFSGNSFYETTSFVPTAGVAYNVLQINNTFGINFVISGNFIGGTAAQCGSTAWTKSGQNNTFTAINLNVGTGAASSIQSNTIQNIAWGNSGTAAWTAINIAAGNVNIGTTTGNIIGATTGTGSISITSATTLLTITGINANSTGTVSIQNNNIGSISTGGAAAIGYTFYGIKTAGAAGNYTISGNNIGAAIANSISIGTNGTTTAVTNLYGIYNNSTGTISITENTVQNCSSFGSGASTFTGIQNAGATASLNMNSNTLASNTLAGTGIYTGISNTAAVTATININNNVISSGTLSASTATGAVTTLNNSSAGTASTLSISTNSISGISFTGATGGTGIFTGINSSGTTLNSVITSNNFNNLSLKTTGIIYLINNTYTAPANGTKTIQNNYITTACARAGTAAAANAFYCYYAGGSSPNTANINISGNTFSNITIYSSNTGGFNGINSADATNNPSLTVYNNTISNITCGSGTVNGIYLNGFSGTSVSPNLVYGNIISNISSASVTSNSLYIGAKSFYVNAYNNFINTISTTGTGSLYGIYLAGGTGINAYSSNINTLSATGVSTTVYGVYINGGTANSVYKNQIYNLTSSGTNAFAYGYYVNAGTTNNFYNNFISDIKTPASINDRAVAGIFLYAGTTNNVFYNTIYLNTSSAGATFGSSGIYCNTTTILNLRNNIIINISSPGSTSGFVSALRFSNATLTNYASSSNNNNLYAGTPGARSLIFYNGSSYQTIAGFKAIVTPRDAASHTENTSFINTASTPYDLHISGTPTFVESNGSQITSPFAITDDFDGQPHYGETGYSGAGTAPDIGADEGDFTYLTPSTVSVSISADQCITSNQINSGTTVTFTATPTNGGANPSYQWKLNGNNVGTNSPVYSFIPVTSDVVTTVMTSNLSYVTDNPATSNSISFTVNPHQTTHYISTTGTDNVCSGTISNPWLTIQYAINNSIAGDTIIADEGIYNVGTSQILINKSLTLRAKAGLSSKPKITTAYTSYSYCAVRIAADNVIVDGFEIDGTAAFGGTFPSGTSCYLIGDYNTSPGIGYDNWTVKNCYLHHGRNGVRLSADNNVIIQGNDIGQIVGNCIDCGHGLCDGIKITRNWLHSEQTQFGAKPAGVYYIFDHAAGADIEISYNYCTACRTFCDFAQNNNGAAPSNQVLIMHNTVDWDLAPLTSPVQSTDNAQYWAITLWASDVNQQWNAPEFVIRDNIFSRMKYYDITSSGGALTGQLELKNNLFYKWYLVDSYYPGNAYPLEWPSTRGAVGWNTTDVTPVFTDNVQGDPLHKSTGITANEYYSLLSGSPAKDAASDGTDIGAWQSTATWTGMVNSDWNTAGNWSENLLPDVDASIVFDNSAINDCRLDQNHSVTDITIAQPDYRMVADGNKLTVKGNLSLTNGAQIDASLPGSIIEFAGAEEQIILSGAFVNNIADAIIVNNSDSVTVSSDLTVNDLTINSGAVLIVGAPYELKVNGSIINNAGASGLVIQSSSVGDGKLINNSPDVSATVELYLTGGSSNFHLFVPPVTSMAIGNSLQNVKDNLGITNFNNDLMTYSESAAGADKDKGWQYYNGYTDSTGFTYAPFSSLISSKGYNISLTADDKITFKGVLNTPPHTFNLDKSENCLGWNLVGNPYPCNYDLTGITSLMTDDNGVDKTVYFYNAGSNTYYNMVTSSGTGRSTNIVPPMQGFFVHVSAPGNSLSLPGGSKTSNVSAPRSKKANIIEANPIKKIKLVLSNSTVSDESIVCVIDNATSGFDGEYDAYKLFGSNPAVPDIYTELSSIKYAINSVPGSVSDPTKIPVVVSLKTSGTYKIDITEFENLEGVPVVLRHGVIETILSKNSSYSFSAAAGTYTDFELKIGGNATVVEKTANEKLKTWYNNNFLYINCPTDITEGKSNLNIYDMQGKPVYHTKQLYLIPGQTIQLPLTLPRGVYVTSIVANNQSFVSKIVVL